MPMRIDLDFRHGLAAPRVTQEADGSHHVALTRGQETVVVQISLPSLEALGHELLMALAKVRRC